jgi:hypothetical protein
LIAENAFYHFIHADTSIIVMLTQDRLLESQQQSDSFLNKDGALQLRQEEESFPVAIKPSELLDNIAEVLEFAI